MKIFALTSFNDRYKYQEFKNLSSSTHFKGSAADSFEYGYLTSPLKNLENQPCYLDYFSVPEKDAKTIEQAIPLMAKKHFTLADYKMLSAKEKNSLRTLASKSFMKSESPKEDMQKITRAACRIKDGLDEQYPQGYRLIGIGSSPDTFIGVLKALGTDAVTIPWSKSVLRCNFPHQTTKEGGKNGHIWEQLTVEDWKKYLARFGLEKNILENSDKKVIVTDFVATGHSKSMLQTIFDEIGLPSDKIEFIDLQTLHMEGLALPREVLDMFVKLNSGNMKKYVAQPSAKADVPCSFIKDADEFANIKQSMISKLFYFAAFDALENYS